MELEQLPLHNIGVTGASGFIGSALCPVLEARGNRVTRFSRTMPAGNGGAFVPMGDIDGNTRWQGRLTGLDVIIHLAARVHMMAEKGEDPAAYRRTNVEGTLHLARQAFSQGVRRIVYLSSIKVNGEATRTMPFRADDRPSPVDPYGRSKMEAEQGLMAIARETGLEVAILRPPLVYGPGVGANFLRLMRLVERGVPLPFGAVANRRSLIYLGNLVDAITLCLTHPAAANRTYLVSDGEDVSTPELIRRLAAHMGKRARLLPVPVRLLELAGGLAGKGAEVRRLLGSLCVDSSRIRSELGWRPLRILDEGLAETVQWYRGR